MAAVKEEMRPLNPAAMELEAPAGGLSAFPPVERWEDWVEYDAAAWDRRIEEDIAAGRLDALADEALDDLRANRCTER